MRFNLRLIVFSIALTVAFASLASLSFMQVTAWTGGHHDMARDLGQAGNLDSQYVNKLDNQALWADSNDAEDGNGTFGISEEKNPWQDKYLPPFCCMTANWDHWYEVPSGIGSAPVNTKRFVGWAAQWYINNGYTPYGFKILGRGLHYPQDASMPYHTTAISNLENFGDNHFKYEDWHEKNYDSENMGSYVRWGAKYGSNYNISSDQGIAEMTRELARSTSDRVSETNGGKWDDNPSETRWAMWDFGERASAIVAYAAPGHVNF